MIQSSGAVLERPLARGLPSMAPASADSTAASRGVELALYDSLDAIEAEWRRFEQEADCTVFQSFDWLSTWQRHIGQRRNITPVIVAGRRPDGELLFLIPLALVPGVVRRLTFLGSELCDYNAPLLARDFSNQISQARFQTLWSEVRRLIQSRPQHRHDVVIFTKMPTLVGTQENPFLGLDVRLHPSGAHATQLRDTWEAFYQARRSSATRRRDRTKRKRLGEFGEVQLVTPQETGEIARTLETLMEQKSRSFARMGVTNIFTPPGHREFYCDLATNPRARALVHVSRLDVGPTWAAVNFGLVFHGAYYHVLASYDDGEISRYGPGAAHLRDLLSYAISRGCGLFDFTIGDESYKLEWSDRLVRLYDHVAPATLRGRPLVLWTRVGRHLKRTIKQNPVLWNAFSRLRSAVAPAKAVQTTRSETSDD
jgi:CelD/BcsL family acetyltransferase involved in cellulose biosynthesis